MYLRMREERGADECEKFYLRDEWGMLVGERREASGFGFGST